MRGSGSLPVRIAAVDVGTNSVLLTVAEVLPNRRLKAIYEAQKTTRLGEGTRRTGRLSRAAMERTLRVIQSFYGTANELGADKIWGVGTSAVREAQNGAEFREKCLKRTGLKLEIISGRKEAKLGLLGATSGLDSVKRKITLLDIGGGSTEVTLAHRSTIIRSKSFPIGAIGLTEQLQVGKNIQASNVRNLFKIIEASWQILKNWKLTDSQLLAIGGTVTTLAALDLELSIYDHKKVHGHSISLQRLEGWFQRLHGLNLGKRRKLLKVDPKRADIIVAGTAVLLSFMRYSDFESVRVSDRGLRWGLLHSKLGQRFKP